MKKKTILVIDDEVDLVRLLALNLSQAGYDVLTAHDGEAGLQLANAKSPDLILLDLNMPKKGGLDFYREILTYDERTKFPVLILTARGELKQVFENLQADGFISKPFDMGELLKEIGRIISKHSGELPHPVPEGKKKLKRVLLVENEPDTFNKIAVAFLDAGYIVNAARTGQAGIERVMMDQPDVLLIKLGLPDLSGEVLGSRLHQLRQTSNVPIILYTQRGDSINEAIFKRICEKIGKDVSFRSDDPNVLLGEANSILDQTK